LTGCASTTRSGLDMFDGWNPPRHRVQHARLHEGHRALRVVLLPCGPQLVAAAHIGHSHDGDGSAQPVHAQPECAEEQAHRDDCGFDVGRGDVECGPNHRWRCQVPQLEQDRGNLCDLLGSGGPAVGQATAERPACLSAPETTGVGAASCNNRCAPLSASTSANLHNPQQHFPVLAFRFDSRDRGYGRAE